MLTRKRIEDDAKLLAEWAEPGPFCFSTQSRPGDGTTYEPRNPEPSNTIDGPGVSAFDRSSEAPSSGVFLDGIALILWVAFLGLAWAVLS